MKTTILFLLAALALSLTAQNSRQAKDDETAIRNADQQWVKAVQSKDVDKTVSFYGNEASVLPYNAPLATGRDNIRQLWSNLFNLPGFRLQFAPTKIEVAKSGDMAYDVGTFELNVNASNGSPTTTPGKYVVVWKKENGKWKAVADIFNSDK